MSEKAKRIAEIQARIPESWAPLPGTAVKEKPLLDVGLMCVLTRQLSPTAAEKTLTSIQNAYPDWNELRVSQVQEFQGLIRTKSKDLQRAVAFDVKAYLQEVFQKNHGYDLEFLREDPGEAGKFVSQLVFLGATAGHFLLWVAADGAVPASIGILRVLDRLGVVKRRSSMRKAQQELEPLVPEEKRSEFGTRFGQIVERYCDAKKPTCWECVLVEECRYGKKVFKEWKAQQKRLELQRKREDERRRLEEEKAKRRAEAESRRRAREQAKEARRIKRESDRKKREEAKRKEAEKKAAAKVAKEAARKKAAAKAAKKKKKVKKKTTKKPAKKSSNKKKPARKKPAAKKTTKKTTKKPSSSKKKAKKKPPARKKTKGSRSRRR